LPFVLVPLTLSHAKQLLSRPLTAWQATPSNRHVHSSFTDPTPPRAMCSSDASLLTSASCAQPASVTIRASLLPALRNHAASSAASATVVGDVVPTFSYHTQIRQTAHRPVHSPCPTNVPTTHCASWRTADVVLTLAGLEAGKENLLSRDGTRFPDHLEPNTTCGGDAEQSDPSETLQSAVEGSGVVLPSPPVWPDQVWTDTTRDLTSLSAFDILQETPGEFFSFDLGVSTDLTLEVSMAGATSDTALCTSLAPSVSDLPNLLDVDTSFAGDGEDHNLSLFSDFGKESVLPSSSVLDSGLAFSPCVDDLSLLPLTTDTRCTDTHDVCWSQPGPLASESAQHGAESTVCNIGRSFDHAGEDLVITCLVPMKTTAVPNNSHRD
jgi:hypothetical protein